MSSLKDPPSPARNTRVSAANLRMEGSVLSHICAMACIPPSSHSISLMSGFQVESLASAAAAAAEEEEEEEVDVPLLSAMRGPRKSASLTALAEAASVTRQESAAAAAAAAADASDAESSDDEPDRILASE